MPVSDELFLQKTIGMKMYAAYSLNSSLGETLDCISCVLDCILDTCFVYHLTFFFSGVYHLIICCTHG